MRIVVTLYYFRNDKEKFLPVSDTNALSPKCFYFLMSMPVWRPQMASHVHTVMSPKGAKDRRGCWVPGCAS